MKNNSTKATATKKTAKIVKKTSAKKAPVVTRNYRKQIDNAKLEQLIARAKKEGVNVKAATSVVRFIRKLGFGASNQVVASYVNANRQYA